MAIAPIANYRPGGRKRPKLADHRSAAAPRSGPAIRWRKIRRIGSVETLPGEVVPSPSFPS